MKKDKWQSKDEQNVEIAMGPVMHNNSKVRETNERKRKSQRQYRVGAEGVSVARALSHADT